MNIDPQYTRTDVAEECIDKNDICTESRGVRLREYNEGGFKISRLDITTADAERSIGKPRGSYITVNVGKLWLADEQTFIGAVNALSSELKGLIRTLSPRASSVLVVGLGNRYITSDSVGPLTVKDLTVTSHIKTLDPPLFKRLGGAAVSAVTPGVIGQTGIETAEIVKGAVSSIRPSLVIAVDALAAKSIDRLAVTVQLSDTGIAPGSGIGNTRTAITKETLGVPVISIGVPTVVDSSTMVVDMLGRSGVRRIPQRLANTLDNGRSFFVTVKDADSASREMARLISSALNNIFSSPDQSF